jgi:hypothetical protein
MHGLPSFTRCFYPTVVGYIWRADFAGKTDNAHDRLFN